MCKCCIDVFVDECDYLFVVSQLIVFPFAFAASIEVFVQQRHLYTRSKDQEVSAVVCGIRGMSTEDHDEEAFESETLY